MERNGGIDEESWAKEGELEKKECTILGINKQISPLEEKRNQNSLSSREMESLVALCDTFLPSIDILNDRVADDSLVKLYQTSASMIGIPHQVILFSFRITIFNSIYVIVYNRRDRS